MDDFVTMAIQNHFLVEGHLFGSKYLLDYLAVSALDVMMAIVPLGILVDHTASCTRLHDCRVSAGI